MAIKNRYISLGGKTYNLPGFRDELYDRYREIAQQNIDATRDLIIKELEELLDKLSINSAFRGIGRYGSRYDDPMNPSKSPIVVTSRKNEDGLTVYQIYVNNKVFNILDSGRRGIYSSTSMKFPRYVGNLTNPNSIVVNEPVRIISERRDLDFTQFEDIDEKVGGWVTTSFVKGIKPRRFYTQIIKKVQNKTGTFTKIRRRRGNVEVDDE